MIKTVYRIFSASLIYLLFLQVSIAQTVIPSDPQTSGCSVDEATFNSWFGGAAPVINSPANAADSVGFPINNTKCDFYKWSSQMFLWLTSPDGQSFVFDSVGFFDVSPSVNGKRTLISNAPGTQGGTYAIRSTKGDEVIGETGQAGGSGVLISQAGSIVYYGVHVNDVYAYFLSDQKNSSKTPPPVDFPNTAPQLAKVVKYAKDYFGVTIDDADALSMELKTSWVDASTIPSGELEDYLTISAEVPNYVKKTDQVWSLDGTTDKELAMVGMHIVGTVQNHPEMVWATIEHFNNAPDDAYSYDNIAGGTTAVPMPTSGEWLFAPTEFGGDESNVENAKIFSKPSSDIPACNTVPTICQPGDIVATGSNTISPSFTLRDNPWGSAATGATGIEDPENNAELISINNDVLGFLPEGDVRSNYFLSGAVWTKDGNIPTFSSGGPAFTQKGSLSLANSTMETYHQEVASSPTVADAGCFGCHSISGSDAADGNGVEVSHIYDAILPLPELQVLKKATGKKISQ